MKKSLIIFTLLLMPILTYAQLKISGKVVDKDAGLPYVNVILFNSEEKLITGTTTDENGLFSIEAPQGSYKLKVSYIGYTEWSNDINLDKDMSFNKILLVEDIKMLKEVEVIVKRKLYERKVDRMVFNVDKSVAVEGGDALDALKYAPGVIFQNDQISMLGKSSMRVSINGRILELAGEDLTNFLASIPSNSIKKVEIISNPPAKYEAAGNSGIVNIELKKALADLWNNTISSSYTQATYGMVSLRDNFSLKKDKLELLLNLSGGLGRELENEESTTFYQNSTWDAYSQRKHTKDYFSTKLNLDYNINDKTTFGVQYLFNYNTPDFKDNTKTKIINNSTSIIDSLLVNNGFSDKRTAFHNINTHFDVELDTLGKKIAFDLDYLTYKSKNNRSFLTNSLTSNNQFLNTILQADNLGDQNIENVSAKIDFEYPFKSFNFSYGGKVSFIKNNSDIQFFETSTGIPILDPNQTDDFVYNERIQAVYVSASKSLSKKWEAKIGLRLESTQTKGFTESLNQTNKNSYENLFPTFYLSYNHNDDTSYYFSYGKRIDRPNYFTLNPFRFYYNSNNYSEGNPFLQPSFTHNFELGYNGKYINANAFYSKIIDGWGVVINAENATNTTIITRENYYDSNSYGIIVSGGYNEIGWWENYNSVNLINHDPKLTNSKVDAELKGRFEYIFVSNHSFTLNKAKNFKGQLFLLYNSSYSDNLYKYEDSFSLNIAFRYSMLNNKLNFGLTFNDIFNSSATRWNWETNGIRQTYLQNVSNRDFRISVSYNFGNKSKKVEDRDSGNEDERGRL
ncbi:outer membrane beta-barrel family protein [Flavobacterium sp. '19STA2R22 D10 B1']|uniref:outer membrane beta-barrel family protein n=1 Tax=Flavobacterium aerium TaxID=3037261 RepID=UPI00278C4819|nr:outer membrane beta-barrel family protein [Flavobacterium sp. '19STA2R22 D10 B1']